MLNKHLKPHIDREVAASMSGAQNVGVVRNLSAWAEVLNGKQPLWSYRPCVLVSSPACVFTLLKAGVS